LGLEKRRLLRNNIRGWALVGPAVLFLFLFMIYPILHSFFLTFQQYNFVFDEKPQFIGLKNWLKIFEDGPFLKSIVNTLHFALIYIAASFIFGFLIGFLFARENMVTTKIAKIAIFLPLVIPLSMSCYMFLFILNPQWGIINSFLADYLHLPGLVRDWMNNPDTALYMIIIVTLWQNIGFIGLLFMVGIQDISFSIIEAAVIDGANPFQRIWHIILPSLKPTYQVVGILSIVTSIKLFAQVVAMTGALMPMSAGGPANSTITLYVRTYQVAFGNYDMGIGATMGYFLAVVVIGLFILNFALTRLEGKEG
jgi:ABC-type sugar transport system permease subunit